MAKPGEASGSGDGISRGIHCFAEGDETGVLCLSGLSKSMLVLCRVDVLDNVKSDAGWFGFESTNKSSNLQPSFSSTT